MPTVGDDLEQVRHGRATRLEKRLVVIHSQVRSLSVPLSRTSSMVESNRLCKAIGLGSSPKFGFMNTSLVLTEKKLCRILEMRLSAAVLELDIFPDLVSVNINESWYGRCRWLEVVGSARVADRHLGGDGREQNPLWRGSCAKKITILMAIGTPFHASCAGKW